MKKEKTGMTAGLVLLLAGAVWLALALTRALGSNVAAFLGYFLGPGLMLSGLIVAGVYFFRWRLLQRMLNGSETLASWGEGEERVAIAPRGAYLAGELVLWGSLGTRLEDVRLESKSFAGSEHTVLYMDCAERTNTRSIDGSYIWRQKNRSVTVPPQHLPAVQRAVQALRGAYSMDTKPGGF